MAALAGTHRVNDLKEFQRLIEGVVEPGDIVELLPGTYYLEVNRMTVRRGGTPGKPLVIRGVLDNQGARPVIDAGRVNVRRCVFSVPAGSNDVIFENLEIRNAAGSRHPDRESYGVNATAIYFEGGHNITVRNWIKEGMANMPETLAGTILGADPGFADAASRNYRPKAGSPLVNAGLSAENYVKAIRVVTVNSRTGAQIPPSAPWLKALEEIENPTPKWEPIHQGHGFQPRVAQGRIDIGAFEQAPAAR